MEKVTCFNGTHDKVKDTWDYCNNLSFDEKDSYGISWPPRHYTCSFCRRKFKSAQALGGHMNVHRRDRAMLRQPPSWVVQYPSPNPSPNLPSSSSSSLSPSATLPPATYNNYKLNSLMMMSPCLTSLSSASSASSASIYDERKVMVKGPPRREKTKQSMRAQEDDKYKVMNNGQIARLDLEIGLVRNIKKEDLDLELRLGYS